jgi:hypothetical protein
MPKVLRRDITPEVSVSPALSLFTRPGDGSTGTRGGCKTVKGRHAEADPGIGVGACREQPPRNLGASRTNESAVFPQSSGASNVAPRSSKTRTTSVWPPP